MTHNDTPNKPYNTHITTSPSPMPDRRGFNYSITEEENLLDIIDELLPIGQMEWETVEQRHSLLYPEQQRTVDSLKKNLGSYTTPKLLPEILTSPHILGRRKTLKKK